MPRIKTTEPIATIGIDIGKNTFHLIGLDKTGAIVMQTKLSRNQLARIAWAVLTRGVDYQPRQLGRG